MVDYAGIGALLVGISALVGVVWTIIQGNKNKENLESLKDVVEPMTTILSQFREDVRTMRETTSKHREQPDVQPPADIHVNAGLNLRRQELSLRQQELQWRKMEGAAKALGWFLDRVEEDEEWEEE